MKQVLQNITTQVWYCCAIVFFAFIPCAIVGQSEICDNGLDDDGDLLVDLNDDDCFCNVFEALSLIPNPSFEDLNCCPEDRSQLDCAMDWIQASAPTTDFIHSCDWLGWAHLPPPLPFPDGDGIMGFRDGRVRSTNNPEPFYKEYAGACLISPLLADSSYRFQFDLGFVDAAQSPPIDITFYGTVNCNNLPFGGSSNLFGCPSNSPDWKILGEVNVSGGAGGVWVNASMDLVPEEDIHAIAIGPSCNPIADSLGLYYFFDNLLLTNIENFDLQVSEEGHPCNQDFSLSVPNNQELSYQWYLSGIALEGESASDLTQNYGEGAYQVRILEGSSCRISATYEYLIPSYDTLVNLTICEGGSYELGTAQLSNSGFYQDTLKTKNNCDSIVALELTVLGESVDTIDVSIVDEAVYEFGEDLFSEAGEYPLTYTSSLGCDSLVLLRLSYFNVYIPNAFTPNFDGLDEVFQPLAASGKIKTVDMQIFDRWGKLFFRGSEWDGTNADQAVFVYLIKIEFENGGSKTYSGSVSVIR